MARLIDADDLIKFLSRLEAVNGSDSCNRITNNALHDVFPELIKCAPTINAVPVVHGEWIAEDSDVIFRCSKCENEISTSWDYESDNMFTYCPCCGAKMDLDDSEDWEANNDTFSK